MKKTASACLAFLTAFTAMAADLRAEPSAVMYPQDYFEGTDIETVYPEGSATRYGEVLNTSHDINGSSSITFANGLEMFRCSFQNREMLITGVAARSGRDTYEISPISEANPIPTEPGFQYSPMTKVSIIGGNDISLFDKYQVALSYLYRCIDVAEEAHKRADAMRRGNLTKYDLGN